MFEIITVLVVLVIIGLFAIGAYKAEKVIDAKAKSQLEANLVKNTAKAKKSR